MHTYPSSKPCLLDGGSQGPVQEAGFLVQLQRGWSLDTTRPPQSMQRGLQVIKPPHHYALFKMFGVLLDFKGENVVIPPFKVYRAKNPHLGL